MIKKYLRPILACLALTGVIASTVLGEIVVTTVGSTTGKILDVKVIQDGKTEIRQAVIFVPGK